MGGLEDICNTGLVLGLGYEGKGDNGFKSMMNHQQRNRCHEFDRSGPTASPEMSLSLSLAHDASIKIDLEKAYDQVQVIRQSSPQSTITSFSNANHEIVSIKRERDVGCEDVEYLERQSSRASDEDDDGGARKKLRLTKEQSALLEDNFKEHSTLNPKQKQALAMQLNLRPRQVEVWFQNRRARTKLKQTEVDCEFLKRCCETIKEENRRLQREIHELKALKFASPVYMHLPAATLTMCPSCERVGGGGGGGGNNSSTKGPFAVAPRSHHTYNPFSYHPSRAC
ncbi:homeobox-leucine zipper protein HAT22-like protein [Cinnamomum micranthum f. kanehirae]|uniref:Homeobox-leucine zipper protein HAT22-like protein n=1 Tax=Cinnamomum micranthum f. kanehirae TaxID=337451 RepID=A0A443NWK5_9MAGN|nr:homeobox-leucine zipper protein HAT22-like protein [Cinnamomum micranthum f. kanehirae]